MRTLLRRVNADFRVCLEQGLETNYDIVGKDIAAQVSLCLLERGKPMEHLHVIITDQQFFRLGTGNFSQKRLLVFGIDGARS
jgi:hypothetical protein